MFYPRLLFLSTERSLIRRCFCRHPVHARPTTRLRNCWRRAAWILRPRTQHNVPRWWMLPPCRFRLRRPSFPHRGFLRLCLPVSPHHLLISMTEHQRHPEMQVPRLRCRPRSPSAEALRHVRGAACGGVFGGLDEFLKWSAGRWLQWSVDASRQMFRVCGGQEQFRGSVDLVGGTAGWGVVAYVDIQGCSSLS